MSRNKFKSLFSSELKCSKLYPTTGIYLQLEFTSGDRIIAGDVPNFKLYFVTEAPPEHMQAYNDGLIHSFYLNCISIDLVPVTEPTSPTSQPKEYGFINLLKFDLSFDKEISQIPALFEPFTDPVTKLVLYKQQINYDIFPSKFFTNSFCQSLNRVNGNHHYHHCRLLLTIPKHIIPSLTTIFVSGTIQPDTLAG